MINPDSKDGDGMTPLHYAAARGNSEFAADLTKAGANVNAPDKGGWRPLHVAALRGHRAIAALLINAGADVNAAKKDGYTPLHLAAANGHADIAKDIVKAGADVNAKEENGATPLDLAMRETKRARRDAPKAAAFGNIAVMLREAGGAPGEEQADDEEEPHVVEDLGAHFAKQMESLPSKMAEGLMSRDIAEFGRAAREFGAHVAKLAAEQSRHDFAVFALAMQKDTLGKAGEQTEQILRHHAWMAAAREDFDEHYPELRHEEIRKHLSDLAGEVMQAMGATEWNEDVRDAVAAAARKRFASLLSKGDYGGSGGNLH